MDTVKYRQRHTVRLIETALLRIDTQHLANIILQPLSGNTRISPWLCALHSQIGVAAMDQRIYRERSSSIPREGVVISSAILFLSYDEFRDEALHQTLLTSMMMKDLLHNTDLISQFICKWLKIYQNANAMQTSIASTTR